MLSGRKQKFTGSTEESVGGVHVCTPMNERCCTLFLQPAFLYRIIARLALHPCRVTHMPYRPVEELRRAIDDPEQANPVASRISCFINSVCATKNLAILYAHTQHLTTHLLQWSTCSFNPFNNVTTQQRVTFILLLASGMKEIFDFSTPSAGQITRELYSLEQSFN